MSDLEKFTIRTNHPFLLGVYMAVNAIQDAYLVIDMNDCAFAKGLFFMGGHDWSSTLLDCEGYHRIAHTCTNIENVVMDRSDVISDLIFRVQGFEKCSVVLLSAFPISHLTGNQFDLIIRNIEKDLKKPVLLIPPNSLSGDWLDGYSDTLATLARQIEMDNTEPEEDRVAVVGYMMDRNEEDHHGNLREMNRMLEALDLELVSVWLSGGQLSQLRNIGSAGTIISLPHGRKAAEIIAGRTGARLIETDIPFGMDNTGDWIMKIASTLGRESKAQQFIDREMMDLIPMLEWVVPKVFLHKTVYFQGDIHLLEGFHKLAYDLGCNVPLLVGRGMEKHFEGSEYISGLENTEVLFEPREMLLLNKIKSISENNEFDLAISDEFSLKLFPNSRKLIFGVPSETSHALYDSPFLGFRGCMCFLNKMANALIEEDCF